MQLWQRRKQEAPAPRIQIREAASHPFGALERYRPLSQGEMALYRSIREAVPIVDAAVMKLVRLCGGVKVTCTDKRGQAGLDRFLRTVNIGRGQRGIQSFLDRYLDDMLTYGRGVGEIVLDRQGQDIAALLCADPGAVDIKEGDSPLNFKLCVRGELGQPEELPWQDLLLYTPFQPEAGAPYGTSLLRSMPFLTELLLKIYHSMGQTWERAGTPRYAVICKLDEQDMPFAQERCGQIAQEWSTAMAASREGCVRDFVAAGDVDIRVIGAEGQVLDSQVPVRQILEQLIARTGIPPFLLGLSWSSTERMSAQQADMLTSEITAIRRSLESAVERLCELWLILHGFRQQVLVDWEDINLQDLVEEAKADLYRAQTEKLREG